MKKSWNLIYSHKSPLITSLIPILGQSNNIQSNNFNTISNEISMILKKLSNSSLSLTQYVNSNESMYLELISNSYSTIGIDKLIL